MAYNKDITDAVDRAMDRSAKISRSTHDVPPMEYAAPDITHREIYVHPSPVASGPDDVRYIAEYPTEYTPRAIRHRKTPSLSDDHLGKLMFGPYEYKEYRDDDGLLHRDDGPARIFPDGTMEWYIHGERHRDCAPAVYNLHNNYIEWWKNGDAHLGYQIAINDPPDVRECAKIAHRYPFENQQEERYLSTVEIQDPDMETESESRFVRSLKKLAPWRRVGGYPEIVNVQFR